jgi:hypothetical protein
VKLPFTLFLLLSIFSPPVLAVEVEPARLELTISANEPTQRSLKVTNHTPHPVDVKISTGPYRFSQPNLKLPSAQTWISFEPDRITLGPNASAQVSYWIAPPANVAIDTAGEYFAAILIDELPILENGEDGEGKITIVPRFALPVYLQIRGRELVQVEVEQVSVEPGPSPGLLHVETILKNRGTVHLRPKGTLSILQESGELVNSRALGMMLPLLPTATLSVPALFPLPPPGRYKAILTLETQLDQLVQKEISFEVTGDGRVFLPEGNSG